MTSDKRKTFVAREDLLQQLNEIAKRSGRSLYETVNDVLELSIHASEVGISMRDAIDNRQLIKNAKEKGMVLGLENVWHEMADISYSASKEKSLAVWSGAGKWFAKRYMIEGTDDPFSALKHDLESFVWNVPEFTISRKDREVVVRAISPGFTEAYSSMFLAFLISCLDTLGFEIVEKEASRGSLRLKAILR